MALEKHRKSANELDLEAKVNYLYGIVEHLSMNIRMALPSANIPDLRNMTPGDYMHLGIPTIQPLDGAALLQGRGPRFVSKYNLATDDTERQRLLDSLPKLHGPQRDYNWDGGKYFDEYRLYRDYESQYVYDCYNNGNEQAQEWRRFTDNWSKHERTLVVDDLEGLLKILPSTAVMGLRFEMYTGPFLVDIGKDEKKETVILVPVPEELTYLAFQLRRYSGQHPRTSLEGFFTLRYSTHELCWAHLQTMACSTEQYYKALEDIALWAGMPAYVAASQRALFQAFEALPTKINETWIPMIPEKVEVPATDPANGTYEKEFHGKMVITAPGIGRLTMHVPESGGYYDNFYFYFTPLDEELAEGQHPMYFKVAQDCNRWTKSAKPLISELKNIHQLPVPRRQWERITNLIYQFLAFESPSIEFLYGDR